MEKIELSRNQMITQLLHIGHGELSIYNELGLKAAKIEPELFGHLIAWNEKKGEVRDSKTALPILALRGDFDKELFENAGAHLCLLSPIGLLKALRYHRELIKVTDGGGKIIKKAVSLFIREREKNTPWWDKTVLQHRKSMKSLYAIYHIKPNKRAQGILFKREYPKGSVFEAVSQLKSMNAEEASGTILNYRIPFLIAQGASSGIKGKTDLILALLDRMSASEIVNNTKMLEEAGVFTNPVLRAAYDEAIERTKKDKKVSSLKASKALSSVKSKGATESLKRVQENNLEKIGQIEGDWLILGDMSGSMQNSVELAKEVASIIAKQVKGAVHLVFFNGHPTYYQVTGKTLAEINEATKRIRTAGSTSIGCGLDYIHIRDFLVNGIVICSDGGENTHPLFHDTYKEYIKRFGITPTVYFYKVTGESDILTSRCKDAGIPIETFDLREKKVDYYSLPNLIKTMRANKYALVDEIMDVPLLTFDKVFKREERK